jgi:hypothetical protein
LPDWGQVFPEYGMIDVPSKVELDGLAECGHAVVVKIGFGLCVSELVPSN